MSQQPRAVIWDMDGTLVDTAELHFQAWQLVAAEWKHPVTREDFARTFGWRNAEIVPSVFGSQYTPEQMAQIGDRKEALYREQARRVGVPLLPGVERLLRDLNQAGFRQAIGSSAPRANIELLLEVSGASDWLSTYACAEDTRRGKPDPEVFLVAAAKLAVEPTQCLVVEDAPVGIQAARAAGMKALGVTLAGHHPVESLLNAGAHRVTRSMEQVTLEEVETLLS